LKGGEAYLRQLARDTGADMERLAADVAGEAVATRIAADLEEAARFGFDGVPAFVVDGHAIEGAQPAERFVPAIEAALRR
jgi:predicted DsbA family dithiol-disulfide isomerase